MKDPLSRNLLVRYLYDETSVYEDLAVEDAFSKNPAVYAQLNILHSAHRNLIPLKLKPAPTTIESILNYSRHEHLEEELL